MRLYFLRHGDAGDRADWQGDDSYRPLTDEGIKKMEREARTIAELDIDLDVIVTSPLLRAKQTAQIIAKELALRDHLVEDADVGLDFDLSRLGNVLKRHGSANAMMLVGHDPTMSNTLGKLIGDAKIELKKGALACVDLGDPRYLRGELRWLLPPKVLALRRR